jgi:hypothetical protein
MSGFALPRSRSIRACCWCSGGLHLSTAVYGSGRVPHVRLSVHGPKTDSSNAFTPCATSLALRRSLLARVAEALEGAAPRLFRPMYAGANMGHPSRTIDRVWEMKSGGAVPLKGRGGIRTREDHLEGESEKTTTAACALAIFSRWTTFSASTETEWIRSSLFE